MSKVLTASYILDSAGVKKGVDSATTQFGRLEGATDDLGKSVDEKTSKLGSGFTKLGNSLGNWGVPFSSSLTKVGKNLDDAKTHGKQFGQVLSDVGGMVLGTAAIGIAAVGGVAIKMGIDFQRSVTQLAGAADISVKKAQDIGNAFLDTGGKTIFSGQEMMTAYQAVAGELGAMQGHALSSKQALDVMSAASTGAEASGESLASVTSTLAGVMQAFQVPVSGAKKTMDELYATSRATGVGIDSLGSTMDRLKARLGVAAPTVGDMGTMLVDLAEHGVAGSRGLMVVNTAVTTLLKSTATLDTANAKAANTYSTKMATAQSAVAKATAALTAAQDKAGVSGEKASLAASAAAQTSATSQTAAADAVAGAQQRLAAAEASSSDASAKAQAAAALKVQTANQRLAGEEATIAASKKETVSQQLALQRDQMAVQTAQEAQASAGASKSTAIATAQLALQKAEEAQANKTAGAQTKGALSALTAQTAQGTQSASLAGAQERLAAAQAKLQAVQATGNQSTNAIVAAMQQLGLSVYNAQRKFVGMGSVIDQLQPKLKGMTQQQQLQALGSVFGTSANKALLDTVLAGPAAWDKAQKAVMAHNAAEVAAAKQNQSLGRQFDIIKAQVTDLGTKLGLALIPKLEQLGRVLIDGVQWLEKHKAVAEALAITITTVLGVAVAAFTINKLEKMGQGLVSAFQSMQKLGSGAIDLVTKLTGLGSANDAVAVQEEGVGAAATTAGTQVTAATEGMQADLGTVGTAATTAAAEVTSSIGPAATAEGAEVSTATAGMGADFGTIAGAAEAAATGVSTSIGPAATAAGAEVDVATTGINAALGTIGATAAEAGATADGSIGGIGAAAAGAAAEVDVAAGDIVGALATVDASAAVTDGSLAGLDTAGVATGLTDVGVAGAAGAGGLATAGGAAAGLSSLLLPAAAAAAGFAIGWKLAGDGVFGSAGKALSGVSGLSQSTSSLLANLPTGNMLQLSSSIDTVQKSLGRVTLEFEGTKNASTTSNAQLEQMASLSNGSLTPAMKTAINQLVAMRTAQSDLGTNLKVLGGTFGLTGSQISSFASAAGVNLTGKLDATDVHNFAAAIQQSGAVSGLTAAQLAGLGTAGKTAIAGLSASVYTAAANANSFHDNVENLSAAYDISASKVEALAKAHGVDLSKALTTTQLHSDVWTSSLNAGGTSADRAKGKVKDLSDEVGRSSAPLDGASSKMKSFGDSAKAGAEAADTAFVTHMPKIAESASKAAGSIKTSFGAIDFSKIGADAADQIGKGLNSHAQTLVSSTSGIGANMKNSMYNVGVDAAQGLINGLGASQTSINTTMSNIGAGMVGTMKNALGTHSPSTIFMAIAGDTLAGLKVGFAQNTSSTVDSLSNVARLLTNVPFKSPSVTGAGIADAGVTGSPYASAATGATTVNIDVTVQGQVTTEQELANALWRALVAKGLVNGSAGQFTFTL